MKSIAWYSINFGSGSGGHRTIFQNINYLAEHGYKCDLYIYGTEETAEELKERINRDYFKLDAEVYVGMEPAKKYDMAVATYYGTAKYVSEMDVGHKIYFIQDYEPWFFPMSESYLMARESYKYGLEGVSIGKWLTQRLSEHFGTDMRFFSFCADLDVYKKNEDTQKEDAICFVCQPNKPRRCTEMGLRALQIVQSKKPELKIYLYGSPKMVPFNIDAEHLGLLSVGECNRLYNKCKVGICMSSSNPSRIPFEMMAAGLPVVDLYLENNLYDLPDDGCLLAEPSAESVAAAILRLLDDKKIRKKLSDGGIEYMSRYPLERGFKEFKGIVDDCFGARNNSRKTEGVIYKRKPVYWDDGDIQIGDKVYFRTEDDVKREKEELERKKEEEEWRRNLNIPQKVYLKIRYWILGR